MLHGPLRCQAGAEAESARKRIGLSYAGGFAAYNMALLNNHYIDKIATPSLDKHISHGPDLTAEVWYFVTENICLSHGITFLNGASEKTSLYEELDLSDSVVATHPLEMSLRTTLITPELRIGYYREAHRVSLFFGVGMAWGLGESVLEINLENPQAPSHQKYRRSARGIGYTIYGGILRRLNATASVGLEAGYRNLATGALEDSNANAWVVVADGKRREMNLDFSGPYLLAKVVLRL